MVSEMCRLAQKGCNEPELDTTNRENEGNNMATEREDGNGKGTEPRGKTQPKAYENKSVGIMDLKIPLNTWTVYVLENVRIQ